MKDPCRRLEKAQGKFEREELLIVDIKKEATVGRDRERKRTKAREITAFTRVDYIFMKLHSNVKPKDPISFCQKVV